MIARIAVFALITAFLTLSFPSAGAPPITASFSGEGTYQLVAGDTATVALIIGNFSQPPSHLIFRFGGGSNWLRDHDSVSVDNPACRITNDELDCPQLSVGIPSSYDNISGWGLALTGVTRRPGKFTYTVQAWDQGGASLELINWPDGHPLIVSWVEQVVTL